MSTNSTTAGGYQLGNNHGFHDGLLLMVIVIILFISIVYIMVQVLNRCFFGRHVMTNDVFYHLNFVQQTINYQPPRSSGLHPSVIAALPVLVCQKGRNDTDGDGPVDCVVCLGQLEEGEKVRVLPRCQHLFHVDCIDMWLYSHSTCPVCRANAEPPDSFRLPGSVVIVMSGLATVKEMGSTFDPGSSIQQMEGTDLSGRSSHPSVEAGQDLESQ